MLVDSRHIASVHDGLVVLMHQFPLLVLHLLVFLEESEELIVAVGFRLPPAVYQSSFTVMVPLSSTSGSAGSSSMKIFAILAESTVALEMELSVYHITGIHVA